MSYFPCALLLRLFSIVQFREVLLVAGLCELSCSVAYGRVRFCSAKILLLNFPALMFSFTVLFLVFLLKARDPL